MAPTHDESDTDDPDVDPVAEDCGEDVPLGDDEARASVRHYNNVLENLMRPRPPRGVLNPRSPIYGLW